MTAYVLLGDVRERLADIESDSIQACVTSPPYWNLRDYGSSDQIGGEVDPFDFVATLAEVFREVHRVLKPDGVLWLNIGDSYYNNFGGGSASMKTGNATAVRQRGRRNVPKHASLKLKDLIGIPWRLAFALQTDGWYLRQDVIWAKPNPIPESVTDRCTKAHEYLFMLTKSPRYYFDHRAMQEIATGFDGRKSTVHQPSTKYGETDIAPNQTIQSISKKPTERWKFTDEGVPMRNKRSVWTIPTARFKEAHFAVMPEALVEPCVLASTREGDTVLDPFMGAATVGLVAVRNGRMFAGCELNDHYVDIAKRRLEPLTRLETR